MTRTTQSERTTKTGAVDRFRMMITLSLLFAGGVTAPVVAQSRAAAPSQNVFNIRFNGVSFRGQSFGGFNFQSPTFRPLPATPIQFRRIQFRGLNSPVRRRRNRTAGAERAPNAESRFVFRSRDALQTSSSRSPFNATGREKFFSAARRETATNAPARQARNPVRTARRRPFAPVSGATSRQGNNPERVFDRRSRLAGAPSPQPPYTGRSPGQRSVTQSGRQRIAAVRRPFSPRR